MVVRIFKSHDYNWMFDTETGFTARWGQTKEDDPLYSPRGPEIADIELSTACHGITGTPCSWCYKSNTTRGTNMTLETFRRVLSKLNEKDNVHQIAFGLGDIDANPDLYKIMAYCREYNIVPNLTINGARLTDEHVKNLVSLAGAVAVSHYEDDICFNAVERLTNAGLKVVNIHQLLAEETFDECMALLDKIKTDPRLEHLTAVVFLKLKPKGNRNTYHIITDPKKYRVLAQKALDLNVSFGSDSCSAPALLQAIGHKVAIESIEPCESTLFSIYVDVNAKLYPCSFCAGEQSWEEGIDILSTQDFIKDVWFGERLNTWRNTLQSSTAGCTNCSHKSYCRKCPMFDIDTCQHME